MTVLDKKNDIFGHNTWDGPTDGLMDRPMDGLIDRPMDGSTDGRTDQRMDTTSFRDA